MKKGFTLVELLAVIVILAIISIITIPMIKGVIDKVKMKSLEDSVYGLKSAAELYYSSNEKVETTEFICNDNGCISNTGKKLDYKGRVEGKVKLFSDGKVSICLTSDNYASSILANEKKATTKMGGCDEETYEISEVIAIEKYNEVKNNYSILLDTLYENELISNKESNLEEIQNDIASNYNSALNSSSYEVYLENQKISYYPDGLYNVAVDCKGATGKWNNVYKGVILSDMNDENVSCKVVFTPCSSDKCDTMSTEWETWVTYMGYDPKEYISFNDFLTKEIQITSCSSIQDLYTNQTAYNYLKTQPNLIAEINNTLNFSACNYTFNYKGVTERYQIIADGIYKLEVWGAAGGNARAVATGTVIQGGKGGYSIGYKQLESNSYIYAAVGGAGATNGNNSGAGFNGGGTAWTLSDGPWTYGSGGGATHLASIDGTIAAIGSANLSKIYIIAGGGGGAHTWRKAAGEDDGSSGIGYAGGGTSGVGKNAGTQTSGYSFGQGRSATGNAAGKAGPGGGGGLYGGGFTDEWYGSGAGGSGYIGGVPNLTLNGKLYSSTTTSGVNAGNGKAVITFVGIK